MSERKTTSANDLKTWNARKRKDPRGKPYFTLIGDGSYLGYRRNAKKAGAWVARYEKSGREPFTITFAAADDDMAKVAPPDVLNFALAAQEAHRLIDEHLKRPPRDPNGGGDGGGKGPLIVREAVDVNYRADLKRRGGRNSNANALLCRLGPGTIGDIDVSVLTEADLHRWFDSLINGTAPKISRGKTKLTVSSVNRLCSNLRRALWLVARKRFDDIGEGVKKRRLQKSSDDADDNVILSPSAVARFESAALAYEPKLGVFVATMACTGTRPSQSARLLVEDFHDHPTKPMLNMPKSFKRNVMKQSSRTEKEWIAITPKLAALLKKEAAGRSANEPLLRHKSGRAWIEEGSEQAPAAFYGRDVRVVVDSLKLVPGVDILSKHKVSDVTLYALRHSSIVNMVLHNVPPLVIAKYHNTSVKVIEDNYSVRILRPADDLTRAALMGATPTAGNVVSLNQRMRKKETANGRPTQRIDPPHPATKAARVATDKRQGLPGAMVRRVDSRRA